LKTEAVLTGGEGGEHCIYPIWGVRLTWLGDIGMTEGRTPGEFPRGVPMSGRGGMKGVAGSESGMMDECWSFFFHGFSYSHTRIGDKERERK
jgi:hypothetical protein